MRNQIATPSEFGFLGLFSGFCDGGFFEPGLITGGGSFGGGFLSSFCAKVTAENAAIIAKAMIVSRKIFISLHFLFLLISRLMGKEGKSVANVRGNLNATAGYSTTSDALMTPVLVIWLEKNMHALSRNLQNFTFSGIFIRKREFG